MHTVNPVNHPICFAYPLRLASSFWIQHIPFAMFLIDLLRPTTFVELGTFTGVSYCAFCQAVRELRLETRCYAVDTWEGDPHNGFYGAEILRDLREHHDPLYGGFSQLIQTTFDDALNHFDDGTVDLLHIDGYHTYEAVKNDFTNWLPKMSNRGVMLFHDVEVRERDFGVWRLWQELKQKFPNFELVHGHGLGLLAIGELPPEPLQQLLRSPESALTPLREFFYQLGWRLEKEQAAQMLSAEMRERLCVIESLTEQLAEKEQIARSLSAEMDERGRAVSALTAKLKESEQATQELASQLAEGEQALRVSERAAGELSTELAKKEQALKESERVAGELSTHLAKKEQVLKESERAAEELSAQLAKKEQDLVEKAVVLRAKERALQELKAETLDKEKAIASLKLQMDEREQALTSRIAEKDQEILGLACQAAQRDERLNAITSSLGWRFLSHYGRIKYRYLLPIYRLLGLMSKPFAQSDLRLGIDTSIADTIVVGKGNALYIAGWCYHSGRKIKKVQLSVNGVYHPVKAARMGRPDVFAAHSPSLDPKGHRYRSGFWAIVPLPGTEQATQATLCLQASLSNGESCQETIAAPVLTPVIETSEEIPSGDLANSEDEPLVAICMTTYNPPLDLFARQVQSIINQTHTRWRCIISDDGSRPDGFEKLASIVAADKRFRVYPSPSRLGFYRNFERCLSLVPKEAEFVALSDHDDSWHPDKLQSLLSQFDEETSLVYSDMNIVDDKGNLLADTYWTTRPNNHKNFASLILANTITGAASMFRRDLSSYLLPFPEKIGEAYHDHWIGCVALAMGKVKYVNRALYDYVQHSGNVLGHYTRPRDKFLKKLAGFLMDIAHAKENIRINLARWRAIYFNDLLRVELISRVLELRCDAHLTSAKRRTLHRIAFVDESIASFIWLWIRSLRNIGRVSETLGAENALLRAILWKRFWALKSWLRSGTLASRPESDPSAQRATNEAAASSAVRSEPSGPSTQPVLGFDGIEVIQQKIAPLRLNVSRAAPQRINLLIPTVDLKYFFGGYITKFNLARHLAEAGFKVRIVIVDYCEYLPSLWRQQLQAVQGLERLFDFVELAYAFERQRPLEVSADDAFIATTWWTAHIAHKAARDLKKPRFLYLIQEYEPFTFPMGTFAAVAKQTYDFPHYAIFSTEFLRDYFRQSQLGVFARCKQTGDRDSISFQNSITSVGKIGVEDIANRSPKKLLFYARPEAHAARNMFEMAVLALSQAIESGYFTGEWEFYGIGTVETSGRIRLTDSVSMQLLPRQSQDTYRNVLLAHDLGLSLMYTPHPSLVPIEMASAGMLVVTNTYANKTKDKLSAISPNIIAVEPTVEGVELGLKEAVDNIEDYDSRVRGSHVEWSTDWDSAFNGEVMKQVRLFIEAARQ